MSKLEELIQEYCPDGVGFITIKDLMKQKSIYTVTPSFKIKRNDYKECGSVPIISQEQEFISGYWEKTDTKLPRKKYVCFGDHSENIKYIDFSFVQGADGLKIMYTNENIILARFFYHVALAYYKRHNNYERHFKYFCDTVVPVPPLPVQQEIVRILDSFTELTAELQAELQARKKQYEYYRDELLTPKNEIPKVKLGEFAEICRGGNFQKKDFVSNGYPCIHYGQIYTHYGTYTASALTNVGKGVYDSSRKAKSGDIVMAVTSENIEDVCKATAWLGNEDVAVSGHTAIIHHQQNSKYLSYYFASNAFFNQKKKLAHGTKVIEVTPSSLANIEVPLPSLEVQNRLVNVLDNFDAICTDLNIGLPAEIEARQKQYEFYRDSLLTFAETGQTISQTDRQTDRQN